MTPEKDDKSLAFRNDFDFRPKQSILGCPFAAHARKMRPRADHKRDLGKDDDFVKGQFTDPLKNDTENPPDMEVDSDEEPDQAPDKEDASVILRRGITFGPELGPDETEKTTKSRGIYFTCYQSDIRDGFNLLMTREFSSHDDILTFLTLKQAGQVTAFSRRPRREPMRMVLAWILSSIRDSERIILKAISACMMAWTRRRLTSLSLELALGLISVVVNTSLLHPFEACVGSAMRRNHSRE